MQIFILKILIQYTYNKKRAWYNVASHPILVACKLITVLNASLQIYGAKTNNKEILVQIQREELKSELKV